MNRLAQHNKHLAMDNVYVDTDSLHSYEAAEGGIPDNKCDDDGEDKYDMPDEKFIQDNLENERIYEEINSTEDGYLVPQDARYLDIQEADYLEPNASTKCQQGSSPGLPQRNVITFHRPDIITGIETSTPISDKKSSPSSVICSACCGERAWVKICLWIVLAVAVSVIISVLITFYITKGSKTIGSVPNTTPRSGTLMEIIEKKSSTKPLPINVTKDISYVGQSTTTSTQQVTTTTPYVTTEKVSEPVIPTSTTTEKPVPEPTKGILSVVILEGMTLSSSDKLSAPDAYCEARLGTQVFETPIRENTINPQWNTNMEFITNNLQEDILHITCYDYDKYTSDDYIGRVDIEVVELLKETRGTTGPVVKELTLHDANSGRIRIQLTLHLVMNNSR